MLQKGVQLVAGQLERTFDDESAASASSRDDPNLIRIEAYRRYTRH
jgi:hypothetical protein